MVRLKLTKPVFGWAMYDFANSAYATTIMSVIFSVYFANVLVPADGVYFLGLRIPGESLWSYLISGVMAVAIFLSPSLGALADHKSLKRMFLVLFGGLGIAATAALFWARPGHLTYTCVVFFLSIVGYEMSLVFYNAFLVEVADDRTSGRASGLGFAFGYVGGGLCLALNLLMIGKPALFGIPTGDATLPIRLSLLSVALWWLIFSIPTFVWVKDRGRPAGANELSVREIVTGYLRQLRSTWTDLRARPQLSRYVLAYLIYNDGIQTVLLVSSIFGAKVLGMTPSELGLCYLLIQFVAFAGAMILGRAADRWSHKKVVLLSLAVFGGVAIWGVVIRTSTEFWALGVVLGLVLGGSQAASRSLFAILIPPKQAGEFFALFSIVGKAASLMGPLVFGAVSQAFGLRPAVFSLIIFFLVGGLLLVGVDEKRDKSEVLAS